MLVKLVLAVVTYYLLSDIGGTFPNSGAVGSHLGVGWHTPDTTNKSRVVLGYDAVRHYVGKKKPDSLCYQTFVRFLFITLKSRILYHISPIKKTIFFKVSK